MRVFILLGLLVHYSWSCFGQTIDVVFDLDWTLVYPLENSHSANTAKVIWAQGKPYRITEWTSEVLGELSKKRDLRISFFSGGDKIRNIELLKQIILPNQKSAFDIAYKTLHEEDLIEINSDESLAFTSRFKKSLTKINPDLDRIILVDDSIGFTPPEQRRNQLWLGETYDFYEDSNDIPAIKREHDPPTIQHWKNERNKLLSVYNEVEKVYLKRHSKKPLEFLPTKIGPPPPNPCFLYFKSH